MGIKDRGRYNLRPVAVRLTGRELGDDDNRRLVAGREVAAQHGLGVLHEDRVAAQAGRQVARPGRLGGGSGENEGRNGGDVGVGGGAHFHAGEMGVM
ncbi:hypothetical protein ACQRIU_003121 [Beauveria bassiana]